MTFFSTLILKWYSQNKRDLPWRKTTDSYKIWISEIILQQTRVDQGIDYYNRFIREFPNVQLLAKAKSEKVLKLWQGLGYYSRARNLHHSAKEIVQKYDGIIPDNYNDLLKLKGIGDYTACAILSIAYNKAFSVVDGNVMRVISRIFEITKSVSNADVLIEIKACVKKYMPAKHSGNYSQALMEFGALQCKPQSPDCATCCLNSICIAFKNNIVGMLPVKKASVAVKKRYLNYFLIQCQYKNKKSFLIKKRMKDDIWKNLYDLPCIETQQKTTYDQLKKCKEWKCIFGKQKTVEINAPSETIHKLSHQILYVVFYDVSITQPLKIKQINIKEIKIKELPKFPVPRLIEKFLISKKFLP